MALAASPRSANAAYFLLQLTPGPLNPDMPINIIVSGRGNDLGTDPQQAAAAKAKVTAATYPDAQILVISTEEDPGNAAVLKKMGYEKIKRVDRLLTGAELIEQLSQYREISSLNVYGHSGITPGVFLDRLDGTQIDQRWNPNDPVNQKLTGHFASDAMVIFNGCNMGEEGAPALSNLWRVPVAGALTSTHFEGLYPDGKYYWIDSPPKQCPLGLVACYRMRPDNNDYRGAYGHYDQGLPNYEFFCARSISKSDCEKAMARSVLTDVSTEQPTAHPTYERYAETVREWLCPSGHTVGDPTQAECMANLQKIDPASVALNPNSPERFYTPYPREGADPAVPNMVECDFQTCYATCKDANKEDCAKNQHAASKATSFVDEYLDYLRGYSLLFGNCEDSPTSVPPALNAAAKMVASPDPANTCSAVDPKTGGANDNPTPKASAAL